LNTRSSFPGGMVPLFSEGIARRSCLRDYIRSGTQFPFRINRLRTPSFYQDVFVDLKIRKGMIAALITKLFYLKLQSTLSGAKSTTSRLFLPNFRLSRSSARSSLVPLKRRSSTSIPPALFQPSFLLLTTFFSPSIPEETCLNCWNDFTPVTCSFSGAPLLR